MKMSGLSLKPVRVARVEDKIQKTNMQQLILKNKVVY